MATSIWIDRKEVWKSKARDFQLRLRNRFRVVVTDRRNRPIFNTDDYFSSTAQRWLHRFHDFRTESLPSSKVFYRKRVIKDANDEEDSALLRMVQAVAVPVIGNACHVFMNGLNRVRVYGAEHLHDALLNRPKNKPLLTVSNHVAAVDDPFVISALLPPKVLLDAHNLRWTLCASDRCFTNPVTSAFFRSVKVLPVSRGEGIYQKGMDMAILKLNSGGWVHIFPEGSRSRDGGKTMGSAKKGVARLVMDADNIPIVIPFVHTRMQDIMPVGAKVPRIGKEVTVLVGHPIHFDDLLNEENLDVPRGKLYDAVSLRIGQRLRELKAQVDKIALEESLAASQRHPLLESERVAGFLHQVDWESFGMESFLVSGNTADNRREWNFLQQSDHPQPVEPSNPVVNDRFFRAGITYEGGIMSRISRYVNPTELMGFAARGLFVDSGGTENHAQVQIVQPLRAWKQYLAASLQQQWNAC
ncbi:unnamed protein product [Rhodiola kirilowii]